MHNNQKLYVLHNGKKKERKNTFEAIMIDA